MRVMHVLRSLEFGGAERLVMDLAGRQMAAGGIEVALACLLPGGDLEREAASRGIPVRVAGQGPVRYLSGIMRLRSIIRENAPDVVHTHNFLAQVHGAPAARSLGIPVIHTKHGRAVSSMGRAPWLRRYIYGLSSSIVVVSRETGEVFAARSGIDEGSLTVVYNGIDTDRYSPPAGGPAGARRRMTCMEGWGDDPVVFGAVSRLDPVKDHPTMLRAFAEVAQSDTRSRFMIVGEGPEREGIEKMVREMGLEERVLMTGFTEDVALYLSAMDMYMQPSLEEGLSLTLLEAASCGVPVVATRVGGNPEVIEDGVTGRLVEAGDWKGLAGVMKGFISDPLPFQSMAVRAREKIVRDFSLKSMEEAYRGLYVEAISAAAARGAKAGREGGVS